MTLQQRSSIANRRTRIYPEGLCDFQIQQVDALVARSYGDDIDIRIGPMSQPPSQERPGVRDDHRQCAYVAKLRNSL